MPWVPKSAAEEAEGTGDSKTFGAANAGTKGAKNGKDGGKGGKEGGKSSREISKRSKEGGESGKDTGKSDRDGGKGSRDTHNEFGKGGKDSGKSGKGAAKNKGDSKGFSSELDWKGGKKGGGKTKSKDIELEESGGKKGKGKSKEGKGREGKGESYGDGKGGPEKPERTNRSDDARRQVLVEKGKHTEVKKHSSMGCAVVTMTDPRIRRAILSALGAETEIAGIKVKLKPHFDKETDQEVQTDLFVGWGRQVEKATPLKEGDIVNHFDQLAERLISTSLDELTRAGAQNFARPPHAPTPPGAAPGVMQQPLPGAGAPPPPPTPAMPQQAAYQQYAQAQAHWAAQQQYAQYLMMYQQQQQQQQAYAYQHHLTAMANQAAVNSRNPQQGGREYKAAYRRPTDDEVKNRLQRIQVVGPADTTPAAPTTPATAQAAVAPAAPPLAPSAPAPASVGNA